MKNKKTGLFFGTFNPIHVGHLIIANYMAEFTPLDEVWLVVSPQNPLKQKKSLLADYHRLAMARVAVEDNLRSFHKWKNHEELLKQVEIYVYPRALTEQEKNDSANTEKNKFLEHPKVHYFEEVPVMKLSASFIRDAIEKEKMSGICLPTLFIIM
jgi:nicotinate-nucleotide adenylyltransferase